MPERMPSSPKNKAVLAIKICVPSQSVIGKCPASTMSRPKPASTAAM